MAAALLAGIFFLNVSADRARATEAAPEKAQVLLDKVKQSELNREIAAKQTAVDRLKEDLEKNSKDAEALQQTIDSTSDLIADSTKRYDELSAERKRLQHDLNLTIARIEAEGQRIDGLRNLSAAQGKSLSALTRHIEETEVRSRLRTAEMQAIADGKLAPGEEAEDKRHPELTKLRKTLNISEAKTASEEKLARAAMKAASAKVQLADLAAARVQRMSGEPAPGGDKADETPATESVKAPESAPVKPIVAKAIPVAQPANRQPQPEPIGERPVSLKR